MRPQKGILRYFKEQGGWVIVSSGKCIELNHDNIEDFGIRFFGRFYRCFFHFNHYGELCVWIDETEFSLSRTSGYEVEFLLASNLNTN